MTKIVCKACQVEIQPRTAEKYGGMCVPCSRGARTTCKVCGAPTLKAARGVDLGSLCNKCHIEKERTRPTEIERFVRLRGKGDCRTLVKLFKVEEALRRQNESCYIGLNLIDPPEHYGSAVTPSNTVAFAGTGGDDVHFSLVTRSGRISEDSPVVVTVPEMAPDLLQSNFIIGENLHDFLCLGCLWGYSPFETLPYEWDEVVADLSSVPGEDDLDEEELKTLELMRRELDLHPWPEVGQRLLALQERRPFLLKAKRWWSPSKLAFWRREE